jgi:hypothetical protein
MIVANLQGPARYRRRASIGIVAGEDLVAAGQRQPTGRAASKTAILDYTRVGGGRIRNGQGVAAEVNPSPSPVERLDARPAGLRDVESSTGTGKIDLAGIGNAAHTRQRKDAVVDGRGASIGVRVCKGEDSRPFLGQRRSRGAVLDDAVERGDGVIAVRRQRRCRAATVSDDARARSGQRSDGLAETTEVQGAIYDMGAGGAERVGRAGRERVVGINRCAAGISIQAGAAKNKGAVYCAPEIRNLDAARARDAASEIAAGNLENTRRAGADVDGASTQQVLDATTSSVGEVVVVEQCACIDRGRCDICGYRGQKVVAGPQRPASYHNLSGCAGDRGQRRRVDNRARIGRGAELRGIAGVE